MNDRDQYLIDSFLQDTLSEKEKNEFRQRQNDPTFLESLKYHQTLADIIALERKDELLSKSKVLEKKWANKKWGRRVLWFLLASIVAIFICQWLSTKRVDTNAKKIELILAEQNKPFENTFMPIRRNELDTNILSQAFAAYENQDYETSIELFLQTNEDNSEPITFYLGVSYFMENRLEEAMDALAFATDSNNESSYYVPANWYIALIYLKQGDEDSAKTYLNIVINQEEFIALRNEAQVLLKLID